MTVNRCHFNYSKKGGVVMITISKQRTKRESKGEANEKAAMVGGGETSTLWKEI